jgi:hypothetical protein
MTFLVWTNLSMTIWNRGSISAKYEDEESITRTRIGELPDSTKHTIVDFSKTKVARVVRQHAILNVCILTRACLFSRSYSKYVIVNIYVLYTIHVQIASLTFSDCIPDLTLRNSCMCAPTPSRKPICTHNVLIYVPASQLAQKTAAKQRHMYRLSDSCSNSKHNIFKKLLEKMLMGHSQTCTVMKRSVLHVMMEFQAWIDQSL